jgi:endoglucanase Acf2
MFESQNYLLRTFCLLLISVLFISSEGLAQQLPPQQSPQAQDYSDEQLESFVEAAMEVMPIQEESQLKMIEEIEQKDLTVERFNMILESQLMGQDADIPEEEMEAFESALKGVQQIQLEYHEKIINAIEGAGMTPAMYEEIMANYQQDPELQMRVNGIMEEMN